MFGMRESQMGGTYEGTERYDPHDDQQHEWQAWDQDAEPRGRRRDS